MVIENISRITKRPIIQICWLVDDMEKAARRWIELMGAGPFFLIRHIEFEELTYMGKPSTLDQSSAVGQWGPIQVELFEQHCNSPAGFRDYFSPGQIQHVTWAVDNFDEETRRLEGMGLPNVWSCKLAGAEMRINWFDARPVVGTMVEIYETNEIIRMMYKKVSEAARDWNGERPIRESNELGLL